MKIDHLSLKSLKIYIVIFLLPWLLCSLINPTEVFPGKIPTFTLLFFLASWTLLATIIFSYKEVDSIKYLIDALFIYTYLNIIFLSILIFIFGYDYNEFMYLNCWIMLPFYLFWIWIWLRIKLIKIQLSSYYHKKTDEKSIK